VRIVFPQQTRLISSSSTLYNGNSGSSTSESSEQVTEFGRVYLRQDNGRWQAHDLDGKYRGQFETSDDAVSFLQQRAEGPNPVNTDDLRPPHIRPPEDPGREDAAEEGTRERIRGVDGFMEFDETTEPWKDPHGIRKSQSKGERMLDDANYILRKSKGAYWVVAGVSFVGVLLGSSGVV
jgi:hypothetical protein